VSCPAAIPGVGAIGVEVTIVEFLDRLLPLEDADVDKELAKRYRKYGVDVLTSTRVESVDDSGEQVTVTVSRQGETKQLTAGRVLQAIGFTPRMEGYGLEKHRRRAHRARGHRDRRPHAHQRPAPLRDRRRHRQADAGPRRRGATASPGT
jgi:NADH dehydrogenase FAD-containing subunit